MYLNGVEFAYVPASPKPSSIDMSTGDFRLPIEFNQQVALLKKYDKTVINVQVDLQDSRDTKFISKKMSFSFQLIAGCCDFSALV